MIQFATSDIRNEFKDLLQQKKFTIINREETIKDLVGNSTIEIVNASFIADEDVIFGKLDQEYIKREEEWYYSQSLNVNDIPGGPPKIWQVVADKNGYINSNYGWCVFSEQNGFIGPNGYLCVSGYIPHSQFECVLSELKKNPESRRAIMIYTRPTMWHEYNKDGRSDFMCTNTVQYLIRDGFLHSIVQMRSNDAIFGYKNDRAWQFHIQQKLANELNLPIGNLYWNVGSLHVYARHYYLIDHFSKTGELYISPNDYLKQYQNSIYSPK